MQAISEHIQDADSRKVIQTNNPAEWARLNEDNMPDSLLAGYLAQRSLEMFADYGDVYQTAGSYRTLAQCFWYINDYESTLICLQKALNENKAINQAPDLVASIWEQLSLLYSAVNDKQNSDINRNLYLDKQEKTRQDRYLESRAVQLEQSVSQLNLMMKAVIIMVALVAASLLVLMYLRKRKDKKESINELLVPLKEWKETNEKYLQQQNEYFEDIVEQDEIVNLRIDDNKRKNLEQRAKVSLVNSITPFIDRMIREIDRLLHVREKEEIRAVCGLYINIPVLDPYRLTRKTYDPLNKIFGTCITFHIASVQDNDIAALIVLDICRDLLRENNIAGIQCRHHGIAGYIVSLNKENNDKDTCKDTDADRAEPVKDLISGRALLELFAERENLTFGLPVLFCCNILCCNILR